MTNDSESLLNDSQSQYSSTSENESQYEEDLSSSKSNNYSKGYFKTKLFGTIILIGFLLFSIVKITFNPIQLNTTVPNLIDPIKLRIYTNNIRFDNNYNDPHERKWSQRKKLITSSIDFNTDSTNANIVCLQEVLHNQLEDILYNLNDYNENNDWGYYGIGRTDGLTRGEYSPILFKNDEWVILENRTFWLSETPDIPSRGWDAALERIVTMITVQSKLNPLIKLNFFNTHFDHRGIIARRKSSLLIIDRMENYNNYPSFLCGDFNTQPIDEPYQILKNHGLKDSRSLIDKLHSYGHSLTFTGFDRHHEENTIIDYIWAPSFAKNENKGGLKDKKQQEESLQDQEQEQEQEQQKNDKYFESKVQDSYSIVIKSFGILQSYFDYYMSDHRPVVADYIIDRRLW